MRCEYAKLKMKGNAMVNTNAIKAYIKLKGITQAELANNVGMDPATLSRKLNNSFGETLTVYEAEKISDSLGIEREQRGGIFFASSVA